MKLIDLHEETSNGKAMVIKKLSLEEVVDLAIKNCSVAVNDLVFSNKRFVRYDGSMNQNYGLIDTNLSERKSQNTLNYYTEIFDSHPLMKDFPKRSKSLICYDKTSGKLISYHQPKIILPFDSAKVGKTYLDDIYDLLITIFGLKDGISNINDCFNHIMYPLFKEKHKDNFIGLVSKLQNLVDEGDIEALHLITKQFPRIAESELEELLEHIYEAYSPEKTGLTWAFAKESIKSTSDQEVWIEGKIIFVDHESEENFVTELREQLK